MTDIVRARRSTPPAPGPPRAASVYDPLTYWTEAGANPQSIDHESNFVRTEVFAHQEERLLALLETLEFRSILEVGCGWGRITKLVADRWSDVPYTAIDLSGERLQSAAQKCPNVRFARTSIQGYRPTRTYDLVLAVECLMHVLPTDIEAVVAKLLRLSSKYVVSLDWAVPLDKPIAPWNFLHPYADLYRSRLRRVEQIGLQAIYLAESLPAQHGPHTSPPVRDADTDPALDTLLEVVQGHQRDADRVDVQEASPRVVAPAKRLGAEPPLARDKGESVDLHLAER